MKRYLILIQLLLIPLVASANADTLSTEQLKKILSDNPLLSANNNCPYPDRKLEKDCAPKGYKPFYISHYGRHGSRYSTSAAAYDQMAGFLTKAHEAKALSEEGESLFEKYMDIYPSLRNHNGDLTELGQQQHRGVAHRMVKRFPEVFKGDCRAEAHSSVSPRAIISMMSFCDQLRTDNKRIHLDYSSNSTDMYYTALARDSFPTHNDLKKMSASKNMNDGRDQIVLASPIPKDFFNRYFSDMEYVKSLESPDGIMMNIFRVTNNLPNILPGLDWSCLFTDEERFALWEISNYQTSVMFTWHPATQGLVPAIASPLLEEIILDADKDLAGGNLDIRLRFGHDTVLGPLVTLLGIEGWSDKWENSVSAKNHYQCWNLPMASNLQIVFYRNKSGKILVKVMYNEEAVTIPLDNQETAPYYNWEDFRAYCLEKVERSNSYISSFPRD